jgi:two-component system LytT family response regulator
VDYLVKPFTAQRFRTAIERARDVLHGGGESYETALLTLIERLTTDKRELERRLTAEGGDADRGRSEGAGPWLERLQVRVDGRILFVRVSDIDWLESSGNYVRVHAGTESYQLRESLTNLAARLDPARFARIHRTTVVNIDRVREIQPWFSGDYVVLLRSGAKLRMSRNYRTLIDGDA